MHQPPDIPARRLWTNAAWGGWGSVCYAAGRYGAFVLLVKFLSPQQVGAFALALAIVTPISFLLSMGLRLLLVTDTTATVQPGHCLALRTGTNLILLAILIIIAAVFADNWPWQKRAVFLLVGATRTVENWADIYLGVMQKHERMKYVGISQLIKTALALLAIAAVLLLGGQMVAAAIAWLLATAATVWLYDRPRARRLTDVKMRWNSRAARTLAFSAIPLGLYITLSSFNDGMGRYFLAAFHGDDAVAYFAALAMIVTGFAAVQNGINQSLMPRLAHYFRQARPHFNRLLRRVLALLWLALAALLLSAWLWGRQILQLLYRQDYADHVDVFMVVLLGGALLLTAMTLGDALIAAQRFKSRLLAVVAGLAVNALFCHLWVDTYSLAGVAWAGALGSAAACVVCVFALRIRR